MIIGGVHRAIVGLALLFTFVIAEDFYELLGVTKSATQRDIRRAFKRLALEKHPDKRTVGEQFTNEQAIDRMFVGRAIQTRTRSSCVSIAPTKSCATTS